MSSVRSSPATERYYGDFGRAAAYVDNHVAFGGLYVEADAEGCGHRLVNHVDVATVGMFRRVAHGAYFDFRRARGYAHDHAQRRREPVVLGAGLLDEAAYHQLGGVEVGDDALAQGAHGAYAGVPFALHQVGFLAYGDELVGAVVEGDD